MSCRGLESSSWLRRRKDFMLESNAARENASVPSLGVDSECRWARLTANDSTLSAAAARSTADVVMVWMPEEPPVNDMICQLLLEPESV